MFSYILIPGRLVSADVGERGVDHPRPESGLGLELPTNLREDISCKINMLIFNHDIPLFLWYLWL